MFKHYLIIAFFICIATSLAQDSAEILLEKEKIKEAIKAGTEAWRLGDLNKWADAYSPESFVLWVNCGVNFYAEYDNWKELYKMYKGVYKRRKGPLNRTVTQDNFKIRVIGDAAFAVYDQTMVIERDDKTTTYKNREMRTLEKIDGEWKIIFMGALAKSQYSDTTWTNTEDYINSLGYMMLAMKKPNEAAKLLKLNTEFFPNSANTWDSLGEAYMMAGENELAIENYQKSLELNPDNKSAKRMLKKLKK